MPLSDCQHWIFDMDGTLTQPVHDFDAIRQQLGIPLGKPILEYMDALPSNEAQSMNQKLDDLEMEIAYKAKPQPGIDAVLRRLKDNGRCLGILTRNSEDIARVTLDACGLGIYFTDDVIVGRDKCLPKPLPDGVLHLVDYWKANKQHTVMVGDYLYDIEAGRRAGVNTIHFDIKAQFPWPEFTDFRVSQIADIDSLF